MESSRPLLSLDALTTGYQRMQVLSGLHLTVKTSEIVSIIGPNGAGKSTVLKAIYGFLAPWEGAVRFRGEDISPLPVVARVKKGMILVHQNGNIFPGLTLHENLEMGGYLIARGSLLKERIDSVYEQFPFLYKKRRQAARVLSGGERQLLAIGMALVSEPKLILLDEPSMGLAPRMMARVFEWVGRIHEMGKSILMVEQNARQALAISHRGYVLDLGKNRFEGRAADLLEDPKVLSLYLGGENSHENL